MCRARTRGVGVVDDALSDGSGSPTRNEMSGVAGTVVQAGAIHGGLHVSYSGPALPVPNQSRPSNSRHFIGRDDVLTRITTILDAASNGETSANWLFTGTAGIGRPPWPATGPITNRPGFPTVLYVNLRGFDPCRVSPWSPPRPSGVPRRPRRAPSRVPADPDAQAALYRSLVAGRKMFVLLDNARDPAQAHPCYPAHPAVSSW